MKAFQNDEGIASTLLSPVTTVYIEVFVRGAPRAPQQPASSAAPCDSSAGDSALIRAETNATPSSSSSSLLLLSTPPCEWPKQERYTDA